MSKERYVSYDIAKLLKEKGFNWELRTYYNEDGDELTLHDDFADMSNSEIDTCDKGYIDYLDIHCTRPTQQMACHWLREEHNIHIEPHFLRASGDYVYDIIHSPLKLDDIHSFPIVFSTREEAIEAALEYVLKNLI